MKPLRYAQSVMYLGAMVLCSQVVTVTVAEDASPAAVASSAPVVNETRPIELSPGVADIVKLSRARVSDEVVIAFVKNSARTYRLSAAEILYLREQGVSDPVVAALLGTGKQPESPVAHSAPQPAPAAPPAPASSASSSGTQVATTATAAPASTVVTPAPVYVQPSPVYVYPPAYSYYYDPYPYYGGWWGPGISLSFGFGGGHYGHYGGYRGGYHGGGYHGGGHR